MLHLTSAKSVVAHMQRAKTTSLPHTLFTEMPRFHLEAIISSCVTYPYVFFSLLVSHTLPFYVLT